MRIDPRSHRFRHSADNIIILQIFFKRNRVELCQFPFKSNFPDSVNIFPAAVGPDKLLKTHGIHMDPLNFSNGKRNSFFPQRHAQKRSGRYDMKFRQILTEILKRLYGSRAILYFIKNHKCRTRYYLFPQDNAAKLVQNPVCIKIIGKH